MGNKSVVKQLTRAGLKIIVTLLLNYKISSLDNKNNPSNQNSNYKISIVQTSRTNK